MKHLFPTGTLTNTLQWVNKKSQECCGYWQRNPQPSRHKRRRERGWEKLIDKGMLRPNKQDGGKSIPGQRAPSTKAQKHPTRGTRELGAAAPHGWGVGKPGDDAWEEETTKARLISNAKAFGLHPEAMGGLPCQSHGDAIQYSMCFQTHPSLDKLKTGIHLGQINIIPKTAISEHCVWNLRQKNKKIKAIRPWNMVHCNSLLWTHTHTQTHTHPWHC